MTVLGVVGSRSFDDYNLLRLTLDAYENITKIVSGGAGGADTLAYRYACSKGITFVCHPPLEEERKEFGFSRAAKRRNLRIVEHCDKLVAFPASNSRGTWHTINLAKRMNKEVDIYSV